MYYVIITLLDIVVGKGPSILELLSSEDQPLLIWGNSLLILDLGLDILDGVGRLHLEGDGLARKGLHENLHREVTGKNGKEKGNSNYLLEDVFKSQNKLTAIL